MPIFSPLTVIPAAIFFVFKAVPLVVYLFGVGACLKYRRLSHRLIRAAWGFGGLSVFEAMGWLDAVPLNLGSNPFLFFIFRTSYLVIRAASTIALVSGLSGAFAEISWKVVPPKRSIDELE